MFFGSNLRYLRETRGKSQLEMGDFIGVSKQTISVYEKGEVEPPLSKLISMADYFGVSVDDLLRKDLRPAKPFYSENLRYLRGVYQMSQEDAAKLLGFKDKSSCCLVENGKQKLSIEQLIKVSEYFGYTLDQFVKQDLSEVEHGNRSEDVKYQGMA